MTKTVGVIAIQGDFEKHIEAFSRIPGARPMEVRTAEDLENVDSIVIPGGESTTVGKLMQRFGLGEAIKQKVGQGMPIWGTCMGMILMAHEVEESDQFRLSILDITVKRNAFGSQVHSFEDSVDVNGLDSPVLGVFIRAPIVTQVGPGVEVLAKYDGEIVAVRSGNKVGTSFHPELTPDTRFHEWFLTF